MASLFASPPYLAPGSGLRSAWPFGSRLPGGRYLVRLPCPHPGCCAAFAALLAFAPTAFSIPLPPAVPCFYRAVLAQEPGRPVRSLGTHRVMHPPAASKSQNIWVADLHRLAGPLPPSVRLPSEGWSAVVCCDGCNVSALTCICQECLLKYFKSANFFQ